MARQGPFHLVLASGLFDDLHFFFTNLGRRNRYRVWMESLAGWNVIECSDTDLRRLVVAACGPTARCHIRTEATGLTWLVSVAQPKPA